MGIAFANSYLAIEPALSENNIRRAIHNSFILRRPADATYIVPIFLILSTWPSIVEITNVSGIAPRA